MKLKRLFDESTVWQVLLARARHTTREDGGILLNFIMPVCIAAVIAVAFAGRPPEPPSVVVVGEGADATALFERLSKDPQLRVQRVASREEALHLLGRSKVALAISPGASPTLHLDPARPESLAAELRVEDSLQRQSGRADVLAVVRDERATPVGGRYVDFLFPGLLGYLILSNSLNALAFTVVWMRTGRFLKRAVSTPMRRSSFLLGFLGFLLLQSLVDITLFMGSGHLAFGVPIRGSIALFYAFGLLGTCCVGAIGLLVASRMMAMRAMGVVVTLIANSAMLVSGVFFSTDKFPVWLHPVLDLLPLKVLVDGLRAIALDGAGPALLAWPAAVLCAWGAVSFAIGSRVFRWY